MNRSNPRYRLYCLAMLALCAPALPALGRFGEGRRVTAPALVREASHAPARLVDSPEDAYRLWRERGFRGRVVVSVGRRLNFVPRGRDIIAPSSPFPLAPVNPARLAEQELGPENFLRVALETGLAREIVHLVPEAVFREKAGAAGSYEGATLAGGVIRSHYFGAPRSIRPLAGYRAPAEPVLLVLSASVFADASPEDVYRQLAAAGIRTDSLVLTLSRDDREVREEQQKRLRQFRELLRGGTW